jgi:hypothetical protein
MTMTDKPYTEEQLLAYEVARDLLNTYVADCSAELGIEEAKPKPDMKRIEKIDAMRLAILNEREDLNITDDAAMEAVIAKYRRTADAGADPRSVAASFATELAS